jgi:diguanylate cyclase (GGDEF)-like protein
MSSSRLWTRLVVPTPDPDVRRDMVIQAGRSSRRSNLLSSGLIVIVVVLLHDSAGLGVWFWAAIASVCLVAFDRGIVHSLRQASTGIWTSRHHARFSAVFVLSGLAWGSPALLAVPDADHASDQAVIASVAMMAIAANLVFGSAMNAAFAGFQLAVTALSVTGFLLAGTPGLAALILFAAVACLPLRAEVASHLIDAAVLARRNESLARRLAEQGAEVERANLQLTRANAELSRRATRDPLTGLANRDRFGEHLAAALERSRSQDGVLSVMYLDLDRFKEVNDTLGHAAGDELLTGVADRLSSRLRPADLLARLGGDEFTIVATTGTADEALALAEQVRAVLEVPFLLGGNPFRTSVSVGVASTGPDEVLTAEELVERADSALYAAKGGGRNGVRAWSRPRPGAPVAPARGATSGY